MDRPSEILHSVESNNATYTILSGPQILVCLQEQTKLSITSHFAYPSLCVAHQQQDSSPCMLAADQPRKVQVSKAQFALLTLNCIPELDTL